MIQATDATVEMALDDFTQNVFPNLFPGKTESKPYKRVYALISERRKQLAGKKHRLNDDWIIRILSEFAPDRYTFNRVTTVTINVNK